MIVFSLEQRIIGVTKAQFDGDQNAQLAFKVALTRIVPGLAVKEITIDSTSANRRMLQDGDAEKNRRQLQTGAVTIDYTVSTYAEAVSGGSSDGEAAADSVRSSIDAASDDGSLSTEIETAAASSGSSVMSDVSIESSTSTSSVAITQQTSPAPTGQPSSEPSSQPSSAPSSQPSMQPTSAPSGQPSAAPTNSPVSYYLLIDFEFVLATEFPDGGTITVYLPQIARDETMPIPGTTEPVIVEKFPGYTNSWIANWFANNQTLELTTFETLRPGRQEFTIGSEALVINDQIIYDDDTRMTYSLKDRQGITASGGVFDEVVPRGLASSSLTFDTPVRASTTGITISFEGENYLAPNDRVTVYLPEFTPYVPGTLLSGEVITGVTGTGSGDVSITWSDQLQALLFTLLQSAKTVEVTIPAGVLSMGTFGANNYSTQPLEADSKLPQISLRTENFRYFAPSDFGTFTPVGFISASTLGYSAPALAGQEADLQISVTYSLGIYPGDAIFVSLPNFWTTREGADITVVTDYAGHFSVEWVACTNTLELVRQAGVHDFLNVTTFDFVVSGIRLPTDGVTPELALHLNVSTNATMGHIEPENFGTTQLVGSFPGSSLTLAASDLTPSSSNTFNLTFAVHSPLETGDTIDVLVPGVVISGGLTGDATQYEPWADSPTGMTATFTQAWDASSYRMTFTAKEDIERNTTIVVDVAGAELPTEGFPVARALIDEGGGVFTDTTVTISATSVNGDIAPSAFDEVTSVGFASDTTAFHYRVRDPRASVGVRLQFRLSEALAADDKVTFFSPLLACPDAWGTTKTALTVRGDRGDSGLVDNFDVTFDPATLYIEATAIAAEAAREINLYIEEDNGLKIRLPEAGTLNGTHWAEAEIAAAWTSTRRTIDHYPSNIAGVLIPDAGIDFDNVGWCAFDQPCGLTFMVTLRATMEADEMLTLTHPHLTRLSNLTDVYLGNTTALTLTNSTQSFTAHWRGADNVAALALTSESIALPADSEGLSSGSSKYLRTHADILTHEANLTLPAEELALDGAYVVTTPPSILQVSATAAYQTAVCGDYVYLLVQFDEAVEVYDSDVDALRLYLNTLEYARYYDGNGTDTLRFVYHVLMTIQPHDVADLSVYGPGALEASSLAGVYRAGSDGAVHANVTVPAPFGSLYRGNGLKEALAVSCIDTVTATAIAAYSEGVYTYTAGDVIDIQVTFPRDVEAVGAPTMNISDTADDSRQFIFRYVNVSKEQWLDITPNPLEDTNRLYSQFSLAYDGESTGCLDWNVASQLRYGLNGLSTLSTAMPLVVEQYAFAGGVRYKLSFGGREAPGLLTIDSSACDVEASAHVYLDSAHLKQAIFRYRVQYGDEASRLTTDMSSIELNSTDYLRVAVAPYSFPGTGNTEPGMRGSETTPESEVFISEALPLLGGGSDLGSLAHICVHADQVTVLNVDAEVYDANLRTAGPNRDRNDVPSVATYAETGDDVFIYVNFSSPIYVQATNNSDVTLEIVLPKYSWAPENATWLREVNRPLAPWDSTEGNPWDGTLNYTARLPYHSYSGSQLAFKFHVFAGAGYPNATILDYTSGAALELSNGARIMQNSLYPSQDVNISLPGVDMKSADGLYAHLIKINASEAPVLQAITCDRPAGTYGAGDELVLYLTFSSILEVVFNSTHYPEKGGSAPNIRFHEPSTARALYDGSLSTDRVKAFVYTVAEGDAAAPVLFSHPNPLENGTEWKIRLNSGYFVDTVNNQWSELYSNDTVDLSTWDGIVIDTAAPAITDVESASGDGTYNPGEYVDVTVHFDMPVVVLPSSGADVPAVKMFVPHQFQDSVLAPYASGNGSAALHFSYLVPALNTSKAEVPWLKLQYAGTTALKTSMRGARIVRAATTPTTDATLYLPGPEGSTMWVKQGVYLNFNLPSVVAVTCQNGSGTYTAGDTLYIDVAFSQEVMVTSHTPVLRMDQGDATGIGRDAEYLAGNNTATLTFAYTVVAGDSSSAFDYVDTRNDAYGLAYFDTYSMALNTDVHTTNTGRLTGSIDNARDNDIVLLAGSYGGIYRSTGSDMLVQARTALPLPGSVGSLSASAAIVVDTSPPSVTSVTTDAPSGSYSAGAIINVITKWDASVTVGGCPYILFRLESVDSHAVYKSGSGTDTLTFEYVVDGRSSDGAEWDYVDTESLRLDACTSSQGEQAVLFTGLDLEYPLHIRRTSQVPTVDANLTLPWVKYVESIIAPTSISGGGISISLPCSSNLCSTYTSDTNAVMATKATAPIAIDLSAASASSTEYTVGDIVYFEVTFPEAVQVGSEAYLQLTCGTSGCLSDGSNSLRAIDAYRDVYYNSSSSSASTVLTFPMVVQPNETISGVTYAGDKALVTAWGACEVYSFNTDGSAVCAGQNLPAPGDDAGGDGVSGRGLTVSHTAPELVGVDFREHSVALGGQYNSSVLPATIYGVPLFDSTASEGEVQAAAKAYCDAHGHSYYYKEVLNPLENKRVIYSTRCPNHYAVCQTADCQADDSARGDGLGTSNARPFEGYWEIPLYPAMAINLAGNTNVTCWDEEVGIALNGVSFYSQATDADTCADALHTDSHSRSIDVCGGSTDTNGVYNYRMQPSCLMHQLGNAAGAHSPQIGWALDGFPIYGGYGPGGITMEPCTSFQGSYGDAEGLWLSTQRTRPAHCLDDCNGLFGLFPEADEYTYRYYVSGPQAATDGQCDPSVQYACDRTDANGCCVDPAAIPTAPFSPYTLGCFKGCQMLDFDCFATSNTTGTSTDFTPMTAKQPTVVYTGTESSMQFQVDINLGDSREYLPHATWDSSSTDESEVGVAVTTSADTYAGQAFRQGLYSYMALTFSEAITAEGSPVLYLTHKEEADAAGTTVFASYEYQPSSKTLMFALDMSAEGMSAGTVACNEDSVLSLNGGRLLRSANFMPIIDSDLSLRTACCKEGRCTPLATITSGVPSVSRVYSDMTGTLTSPETLTVKVQFSLPVHVVGSPYLQLDLADYPTMDFAYMQGLDTLVFTYVLKTADASSCIDYLNTTSMGFFANDTYSISGNTIGRGPGLYDGVLARGVYHRIEADLTLPERGTASSLGTTSALAVDNLRDSFVSIAATPTTATGGDIITFTITYTSEMSALAPDGSAIFDSSLSAAELATNKAARHVGMSFRLVNSTALTQDCVAHIAGISGNDITYEYTVANTDISGAVRVVSQTPFILASDENGDTATIVTAATGATGPLTFTRALIAPSLGTVDNEKPYVVSVFSPNTSVTYPFGVGDVIDIYVEMSHAVVTVSSDMPQLYFDFNESGIARPADFVVASDDSGGYDRLHFQYTVLNGDYAVPLEYINSSALMGTLKRYSLTTAILVADLTLPGTFSFGSLGFCCNVKVDTTAPIINALIPVKHSGTYGENEEVLIIARFNKPVVVSGSPLLLLKTIDKEVLQTAADPSFDLHDDQQSQEWAGIGFATYLASFSSYDVSKNIDEADVLFKYVVNRHDSVRALQHLDGASLHCNSSADSTWTPSCSILHLTTNPTVMADLTLRDPSDHTEVNGRVLQQWKFRYPQRVELLVRDLWHSQADSLNVRVEHSIKKARVMTGDPSTRLRKKTFGRPYPRTRSNSNATDWMADVDAGVGYTYMFADSLQDNIARKGSVEQSGTQSDPRKAIDGNMDPMLGHGSVSESEVGYNSWWQVLLPYGSSVSDINVWPRVQQMWVEPVVSMTIKALDRMPEGTFKLQVSNYDITDATASVTTAALDFGLEAAEVKSALQSLNIFGVVGVTRETLEPCGASGCGTLTENGYGHTYRITFMDVLTSSPSVVITDQTFVGGPVTKGATGETENELTFTMASHAELARYGEYIEAKVDDGSGSNEWLTPFYVMLFDERPSGDADGSDLTEALKQASFTAYVETIDTMATISLPSVRDTSYVRIQRDGYGSISLAEVEVFDERLNLMGTYAAGSPVAGSTVMEPYQPQEPFSHAFSEVPYDGRWMVVVDQPGDYVPPRDHKGYSYAAGTLAEVVLVVTDLAGVVHTYYQDLRMEVERLPKYGALSTTAASTPSSYAAWRNSFELSVDGELSTRFGGAMKRGACYGTATSAGNGATVDGYRYCLETFGVGTAQSTDPMGNKPERVFLRDEKVVSYKPFEGYLGPDYFSYKVWDGVNVQTHSAGKGSNPQSSEVTIHVRQCTRFIGDSLYNTGTRYTNSLCACAQTELAIVSDRSNCDAARTTICGTTSPSNSTDGFRSRFVAMCHACEGTLGFDSEVCIAETVRAVSLLETRGLCDAEAAAMDCTTETVTKDGMDRWQYRTLMPPQSDAAFTTLGNNLGGGGYYRSAPLH